MNDTNATQPPIVLIHGLWLTPRSWEKWIDRYESRGFQVMAPSYPGMEGEVEALRQDASPIERLTIDSVADHYEDIIRGLPTAPIIMGHSFGGTVTQLLLDRGLGCSAVVIDSAQVRGVRRVPISQIRALLPALDNPAHRHEAVSLTPDQFHYAFTNVLDEEESRAVYDRYHVAAPGKIIWDGALANFQPHSEARVDFKKDGRAPLMFIASSEDHLMPPAVNELQAPEAERFADVIRRVRGPLSLHVWPGWLGAHRRLRPLLGAAVCAAHGRQQSDCWHRGQSELNSAKGVWLGGAALMNGHVQAIG